MGWVALSERPREQGFVVGNGGGILIDLQPHVGVPAKWFLRVSPVSPTSDVLGEGMFERGSSRTNKVPTETALKPKPAPTVHAMSGRKRGRLEWSPENCRERGPRNRPPSGDAALGCSASNCGSQLGWPLPAIQMASNCGLCRKTKLRN